MKVVAIGGGFAGLAARKEGVIVIDNKDYFLLVHKIVDVVRTGNPNIAMIPYPSDVIRATIKTVDFKNKKVITDIGEIPYDKLIITLGHTQKALPGALKLENIDDALLVRKRIIEAKSVAILGGGAQGVELASVAREMGKEVYLIEGKDRLLSYMSNEASKYALDKLTEMGVNVMLKTRVESMDKDNVVTSEGVIRAEVAISSIGLKGSSLISELGLSNINDRMIVDEYLRSVDYEDVYGAGDCATTKEFIPMSAQVAVQAGTRAALNALGKDEEKFKYKQLGVFVKIGDEYFGDLAGHFVKGSIARIAEEIGILRAKMLLKS
ncbi:MAG: FAD-dependent oxidoreductase [Sulfolobaceae archaeon]|nr:FAD-dependent oxidoreductase [Sulfolobaceae archaeon]